MRVTGTDAAARDRRAGAARPRRRAGVHDRDRLLRVDRAVPLRGLLARTRHRAGRRGRGRRRCSRPSTCARCIPATTASSIDVDDELMAESMSIETEYGCRFILRGDERVSPTGCDPAVRGSRRGFGAARPRSPGAARSAAPRPDALATGRFSDASRGTPACRRRRAAGRRGRRSPRRPRCAVACGRRRGASGDPSACRAGASIPRSCTTSAT